MPYNGCLCPFCETLSRAERFTTPCRYKAMSEHPFDPKPRFLVAPGITRATTPEDKPYLDQISRLFARRERD